jgi:hypothetical protein
MNLHVLICTAGCMKQAEAFEGGFLRDLDEDEVGIGERRESSGIVGSCRGRESLCLTKAGFEPGTFASELSEVLDRSVLAP